MVIAAAAWSAFFASDLPLARRRAEDALREPVSSDPVSLGLLRLVLAQTYTLTGQPERGVSIAQEGRQKAAELGIEISLGGLPRRGSDGLDRRQRLRARQARRPAMEAGRGGPGGPEPGAVGV